MTTTCTLERATPLRVPFSRDGRTVYTEARALCVAEGDLLLVTGGSKSGKSTFAEEWVCAYAEKRSRDLHYVATMRAGNDPENLRRIALHRKQRAGKGFVNWECPAALSELTLPDGEVILLECLGNLLANAMTDLGLWQADREAMERALALARETAAELLDLASRSALLLVVSNDIFSDALTYDPGSRLWRKVMGLCQQELLQAGKRCGFVEVTAGIPLHWQGRTEEGD